MLTNKQLSLIIWIGAPFYLIGTYLESIFPFLLHSRWTGLWGFLFLSSWLAGLEELRRTRATGIQCHGLCALWTTMVLLALANVSNVWQIISPNNKLPLFEVLDMGWPLAHLMMLVVGVLVLIENRGKSASFQGWMRYTPILMGLWYPLSVMAGQAEKSQWISGFLSAILWALPALNQLSFNLSFSVKGVWGRFNQDWRQLSQSFLPGSIFMR